MKCVLRITPLLLLSASLVTSCGISLAGNESRMCSFETQPDDPVKKGSEEQLSFTNDGTCGSAQAILENGFDIVKPLETPDNYHEEEFQEAFAPIMASSYVSSIAFSYVDYVNLMPHEFYDKYGVGAHRVKRDFVERTRKDEYDYYLLYKGALYNINRLMGSGDDGHSIVEFLFTDYNDDGCIEVTTSFLCLGRLCISYLSTLDTKTGEYAFAKAVYDHRLSFQYDDDGDCLYIASIPLNEKGVIDECSPAYVFSRIDGYSMDYSLAQDEYYLESEHYNVKVSLDKSTTTLPLRYRNLDLQFLVTVEMTYTGETFSYVNPDTYKDSALSSFRCGDIEIPMEGWSAGTAITDFTVEKGEVMTRVYQYNDYYASPNKPGDYDMLISYREETIEVKNALLIREAN